MEFSKITFSFCSFLFVLQKKLGASWFHSDELEMDRTATMVPRREPLKVTKVFQVSKPIKIFPNFKSSSSFNFVTFTCRFGVGGQRCGIDLLWKKCQNCHAGRKSTTL